MTILNRILFTLSIITILNACNMGRYVTDESPNRTLKEQIVINRYDGASYELTFDKEGKWDIYKATDPEDLFKDDPFMEFSGDTLVLNENVPENQRLYFGFVQKEKKDTQIIVQSERLIPLAGQVNFRDLGGIPTKDGRVTKWGKIYRSGHLHDLTTDDLAYLKSLKIKTIIDFRNDIEVGEEPDKYPAGVDYIRSPIAAEKGIAEYKKLKRQLITHRVRRTGIRDRFIEFMDGFADEASDDLKPVMDKLMNPENTPLLYHCSGGKDRTGAMSSIILLALGVEEDMVRDEYLMSNYYRWELNKANQKRARKILIGRETLEYLFVVQKDYINAVFDVINKRYDGIDNYLLKKFNITASDRQKLIEAYTFEPQAFHKYLEVARELTN